MDTTDSQQADMAALFDFVNASMPESATNNILAESEIGQGLSQSIPQFHEPETACDYCASKQLQCFFTLEGQMTCNPCKALFRPCSFTQSCTELRSRPADAIDTLQALDEDACVQEGGLTGTLRLKSKYLGRINRPSASRMAQDESEVGRKSSTRFSKASLKILKDWMEEHRGNPYPTELEKEVLQCSTGLSARQISDWLANTRRREKNKMPKRAASPSIRPSTEAIDVPEGRTWNDLNPFERWQHSPPENEPAPLTAIRDAVRDFSPPLSGESSSSSYRQQRSSNSNSVFSAKRAPSTTSVDTGSKLSASGFSSGSYNSHRTAWSHGSRKSGGSFGSFGSFNSFGEHANRGHRRRRRAVPKPVKQDANISRPFQCTFCTDRFKSKYDWSRHEKSLHLSLEKWICAPLGHTIVTATGQKQCAYCDLVDPSEEHQETHNHTACGEKGIEARTFYRKDHLRQHLRLMHSCKMTESMETWKYETAFIRSRCGFCAQKFERWQERVDHIAKEFRSGKHMKQWKGCRGLDPHIAALVTNAMPPYLIDNESRSPMPFSATNTASLIQNAQYFEQADLEATIPNPAFPDQMTTTPDQVQKPEHAICFHTPDQAAIDRMNELMLHLGSAQPSPFDPSLDSTTNTAPTSIFPASASEAFPSTATCWEYTTMKLGHWTRSQLSRGITPTDAEIQAACRVVLYSSDDAWNQTPADNETWLSLFKKTHGLVEGLPEDFDHVDALEDLGMGHNMSVAYGSIASPRPQVGKTQVEQGGGSSRSVFQGGMPHLGDYYANAFDGNGMPLPTTLPGLSTAVPCGVCPAPATVYAPMDTDMTAEAIAALPFPKSFGEMPSFQLDEELFSDMTHLGLDLGEDVDMEGLLETNDAGADMGIGAEGDEATGFKF